MTDNPSWQVFRGHSPTPEGTFEKVVAKRLFCSTTGLKPEELVCPPKSAGIECHPVETSEGWISFQAKYSHDGKQNIAGFDCLEKAYKLKVAGEYQLDVIYCYSAGSAPGATKDKAFSRKQKEIEALAEKHGVTLKWRFEDQILEQLRDDPNPLVVRAKQEFFEDLPQPPLIEQLASTVHEGAFQYHFSRRATPWVGREKEMAALHEFLVADTAFSWWGVLGEGGSGKSRLLLELGNTLLPEEWRWGWLLDDFMGSFDFSNWQPNKNTLLIADYAIGREQEIGKLMSALYRIEKSNSLQHVIRLLVVEREAGQWFKNLRTLRTIGPWVEEKLYRTHLLSIGQLEPRALMHLAEALVARCQALQVEPKALVEKALAISPERAPLVMQLLATSEQLEDNLMNLVREFIERDRQKRWTPAGVSETDLDVLTVATMSGGIDLHTARWNSSSTREYFASFEHFNRYTVMTSGLAVTGRLDALEPDLFGELFVLDRLDLLRSQKPLANAHKRLLKLAMTINEGRATIGFFSKCKADYPLHPAFSILSSPPEGTLSNFIWTLPTEDPSNLSWLLIASNVIDVPAIEQSQKCAIYRSIVNCRIPDGLFLDLLE